MEIEHPYVGAFKLIQLEYRLNQALQVPVIYVVLGQTEWVQSNAVLGVFKVETRRFFPSAFCGCASPFPRISFPHPA